MSSGKKIQKLIKILTANGGCGCGPKATDIIEPKPKFSDPKSSQCPSSSGSSWEYSRHRGGKSTADDTSTTFSLNIDASPDKLSRIATPCPKIRDSFAVVKDSDDPYEDFRRSMLQMICEREIYSGDDLQQLLDCFLQLNSPQHHELIVRAFMELWNGGDGAATPPCCSRENLG